VPRFWSNANLCDPDTIIALVLEKPTTADLARTIVAYGPRRVIAVLHRLAENGELSAVRIERASGWLGPIIKGVAEAARELIDGRANIGRQGPRTPDEIMASLPQERRERIEARAAELLADLDRQEEPMTHPFDAQKLPEDTVRAYAEGRISWRQIREETGIENFWLMLEALGELGLQLPKADPARASEAKAWLREILAKVDKPE
jgi:hypothetical protein